MSIQRKELATIDAKTFSLRYKIRASAMGTSALVHINPPETIHAFLCLVINDFHRVIRRFSTSSMKQFF